MLILLVRSTVMNTLLHHVTVWNHTLIQYIHHTIGNHKML